MVFITTYFVLFSQIASSLGCALELLVLSKEIIQIIITKPSYVRVWYDYCLLCVCVFCNVEGVTAKDAEPFV